MGIEIYPFACAIGSIFLGSFIKGTIGFGLPIIATPVMILFLPLHEVIALQILPICIANIQQCWLTRRHKSVLGLFWPMIVSNITILFFGSYFLLRLNTEILMPIIGVLIILQAVANNAPIFNLRSIKNIKGIILLSGIASGALGTMSSFYAFPSVQVMIGMKLKREEFVFIVGFFLATGSIGLWLGILANGFSVTNSLPASALLIMPSVIGMALGNKIRNKLRKGWFTGVIRAMLILMGFFLIFKAT